MADSYKLFYRGQLPSSVATIYTQTTGQGIVKNITVVNCDSVTRTFSLFRNGTTDAYRWTPTTISLKAGECWEWDGTKALENGSTIAAVASVATMLTCFIDGDEVT